MIPRCSKPLRTVAYAVLCSLPLWLPFDLLAEEQVAPVAVSAPVAASAPEAAQAMTQEQAASAPAAVDVQAPTQDAPLAQHFPLLSGALSKADARRNVWSDRFVTFANDIDRFFGDPRYFQETNKSVLQLNLTKVYAPGDSAGKMVLDGQAKMDLPSTEKRFSLMLESNPEKNITGEAAKRPVLANDVVTSDNQSAALRVEKPPEDSPWHFSADAGVKVRVPLEPFVRTRASYTHSWENWRMKAAETVFWFSSIGLGETTQVDFERRLSEPVMFRATSTATWMNNPHMFDLRQDFSLYHALNERTALLYQTSVIGVSEPELIATEYVLLMLARYRLHRSWVFFEISPQLHFPKTKNFETSPLLLLRLEVLFDGSR